MHGEGGVMAAQDFVSNDGLRQEGQDGWWGGRVSDCITCVVAENSSPFTFNGSSAWIVSSRSNDACIVIDPGPDVGHHIETLANICEMYHGPVKAVLVTHNHNDHFGGAERFSELVDAPLMYRSDGTLGPGSVCIPGFDQIIECIDAPGHSADTVAFWMPDESALFLGDICFEGSSSLVEFPNGKLSDYLGSMERLIALIESQDVKHVLPGHKGPMHAAAAQMRSILNGRLKRVAQVVESCKAGTPFDCDALIAKLYGETKPGLEYAVRVTTLSTMEYVLAKNLLEGIASEEALNVPVFP